jgi:glutathione S-transferase
MLLMTTPLTLCGFSASNYYNKIKLQLLEKGLAFDEQLVWAASKDEAVLGSTPMGKVPYLLTPQGAVSESVACAEYIEAAHPQPALLPENAFMAAKVRELVQHIELDLELVARVLHPEALWGGKLSDGVKERQRGLLLKGAGALARLVDLNDLATRPYLVGNAFSLADCAALVHLPLVGMTCKIIYGEDLLATALPYKAYLQAHAGRAAMVQVNADRKANTEALMAKVKARTAA